MSPSPTTPVRRRQGRIPRAPTCFGSSRNACPPAAKRRMHWACRLQRAGRACSNACGYREGSRGHDLAAPVATVSGCCEELPMSAATNIAVVNDVVQQLFKERLGRYGFERAEIQAGRDHTDDPALFIDAYYRLSDEPIETRQILHLLTELRKLLISRGEERFPYVRHHFDEKQPVASIKRRSVKRK